MNREIEFTPAENEAAQSLMDALNSGSLKINGETVLEASSEQHQGEHDPILDVLAFTESGKTIRFNILETTRDQ